MFNLYQISKYDDHMDIDEFKLLIQKLIKNLVEIK